MGTESGGSPGKLVNAVRVIVYHPKWSIPCGVCEAYLMTKEGRFLRDAAGELQPRGTLPTPCGVCPKVPRHLRELDPDDVKRLRAAAHELTPANRKFWEFYHRMKAVNWPGQVAADPLVQYLAGGVREVEDQYARDAADRSHESVAVLLEVLGKRLARG